MKKFRKSTLIRVLVVLIICLPIIKQGIVSFIVDKGIVFVDMQKHGNYSEEQKTLLAIENGLLYCDLNDGGALYRYDARTEETQKLSKLDGELKRTENGILYITEREIFQFINNELFYLGENPSDSRGIVDWQDGLLYWLAKNEEGFWTVCKNNDSEDTEPDVLFQTAYSISFAAVLDEKLYIFTEGDGIYCKEVLSGTMERISDLHGLYYVSDGKYMIFCGYDEDYKSSYYEILLDETVKKITEEIGSAEAVFGDRFYYICGDEIKVFNLEDKVCDSAIKIVSKSWERMEVTDDGMFI